MGAWDYEDLKRHVGHEIVCVTYGDGPNDQSPANVAVECETCNEVLLDFDKPYKPMVNISRPINELSIATDIQICAIKNMARMKDYTITEDLNNISYIEASNLIKKLNRIGHDSEEIT